MTYPEPTRRRAPYWVRAFTSKALHGLVGKMHRERTSEDLSAAQEWLYDMAINELEYRRRHAAWRERCSCMFCVPPFAYFTDD